MDISTNFAVEFQLGCKCVRWGVLTVSWTNNGGSCKCGVHFITELSMGFKNMSRMLCFFNTLLTAKA